MSELFRRYASITIGQPGSLGLQFIREKGEGHHIEFDVKLNANSAPDKGVFKLFNLSNVSRHRIETLEKQAVIFDAGYQADHGIIFTGKVDQAWTQKDGGKLVTIIESTDFTEDLSRRVLSLELKDETSAKTLVKKVCDLLGVKIGNVTLAGVKEPAKKEVPLYDGATKILNDVFGSLGMYWHITNGHFYAAPVGSASRQEIIKLSSETGMIESPERGTAGIKGKCLLMHKMKPGCLIQVARADGKSADDAIVTNINLKGATFGQPYYNNFESLYRKAVLAK